MAVRDHLTERNKQLNKLIKTSEDHKAQADKMKAEAVKYKKEASTANTVSLAYKQELEGLKTEQQKLVDTADAKGYQEGTTEATRYYKAQVEKLQDKACGVDFILGLKAAGVPESFEPYKVLPKYPKQKPSIAPATGQTADVTPEVETSAEDAEKIDSPTDVAADPTNPGKLF